MATWLPIVGESHYQRELQEEQTESGRVFQAVIECEQTNRFDPNAIVIKGHSGRTFGYLSREMAKEFHAALESLGGRLTVHAELRGGEGAYLAIGIVFDGSELIAAKQRRSRKAPPAATIKTSDGMRHHDLIAGQMRPSSSLQKDIDRLTTATAPFAAQRRPRTTSMSTGMVIAILAAALIVGFIIALAAKP